MALLRVWDLVLHLEFANPGVYVRFDFVSDLGLRGLAVHQV